MRFCLYEVKAGWSTCINPKYLSFPLQQLDEQIAHYKDQIQELKAKSNLEAKYVKKECQVGRACPSFAFHDIVLCHTLMSASQLWDIKQSHFTLGSFHRFTRSRDTVHPPLLTLGQHKQAQSDVSPHPQN